MGHYKEYIIRYHGELSQALQKTDTLYDLIDERYAIIKTQDKAFAYLKGLRQIEYIEESKPIWQVDDEINKEKIIGKGKQEGTGKGVTVGWISHKRGFNNKHYTTLNGESRIICIHDGRREYTKSDIVHMKNKTYSYESMDLVMGNKGLALESDIILVNWEKDVFNTADLIRSVRFIIRKSKEKKNPLVIYIPFDLSIGGGRGRGFIREIISRMSLVGKIILVSNLETTSKGLEENLRLNTGPILSINGGWVAGELSLLMEWGIIKKKDPFLYGQKLRTYYIKNRMTNNEEDSNHRQACGVEQPGEFRTLDLAYAFASEEAEIDAFIIYNNVAEDSTIQTPQTASLYPLVFPYLGVRGAIAAIKELLKGYPATLITGSLSYILGNEPLNTNPTHFKMASILNTPTNLRGTDTLIGIIDTGIDYTHPAFIDDKGRTRILSIWDQTIGNQSPYGYGTIYNQAIINTALKSPDPFKIVPHKDEWGNGTMLAGVAAGYSNSPEITYKGVAPEASILVVKLQPATPEMQEIYHGRYNPLGFSALDVARAFEFLSTLANQYQKPISICLPMGTNSGSHDGTAVLDTIITGYAEKPGVAVVLSAGEEANKAHHASGNLNEKDEHQVTLTIPPGQKGFMTEIWATFGDRIEATLISPKYDGIESTVMSLNKAQNYKVCNTTFVWSQGSKIDTDTGSQVIRFRFDNPISGDWTIKIKGIVVFEGRYNIWIPKTGMILTETVLSPADPFTTIYNASASKGIITVASYDKRSLSPTASSGRGFARGNEVKPDFMVPAVNIPGPMPGKKWGSATGTSIASAITVGVTSLIYENQLIREEEIANTITMKALLIEQVKREPTITYPDPSRGYGLLDISTIIE